MNQENYLPIQTFWLYYSMQHWLWNITYSRAGHESLFPHGYWTLNFEKNQVGTVSLETRQPFSSHNFVSWNCTGKHSELHLTILTWDITILAKLDMRLSKQLAVIYHLYERRKVHYNIHCNKIYLHLPLQQHQPVV